MPEFVNAVKLGKKAMAANVKTKAVVCKRLTDPANNGILLNADNPLTRAARG